MAGTWDWVVDSNGIRVGVATSRRELTTSTVVVHGSDALLVDPAWEPDELQWIADDLATARIRVGAGFATHAHHDHLLWHPLLGGAPRWASRAVAAWAGDHRARLLAALGSGWPTELAPLVGSVVPVDGAILPWAGDRVELITHDAHAVGHTALWVSGPRVLIAGDMLSDSELPLLEDSDPSAYAAGLAALEPYARQAAVVVPGHGHPAIGRRQVTDRWAADRRYLNDLLSGSDPHDLRLAGAGMAEAHRHNLSRVRR